MKWIRGQLLLMALLCSSCMSAVGKAPIKVSKWNPIRLLPGVKGVSAAEAAELPEDPYAIWQEYAIYIIIAGIIFGVIDFMADRKLSLLGPAIAACGLALSIWGVTIGLIAKILPWLLGAAVAMWVTMRIVKSRQKKVVVEAEPEIPTK